MRNLAEFKRNCNLFEYSLIEHCIVNNNDKNDHEYKTIPDFQKSWRPVGTIQSNAFTLITDKNGELVESWIDFPKASELQIESKGLFYWITITKKYDTFTRIMFYQVRPNLNLIEIKYA